MLCSVAPAAASLQQCEAHIQDVCQKYWLVNITAAVPEAQAVQTAHAIGKHHYSAHAQLCYPTAYISKRSNAKLGCLFATKYLTVFVMQDLSANFWSQWLHSEKISSHCNRPQEHSCVRNLTMSQLVYMGEAISVASHPQ